MSKPEAGYSWLTNIDVRATRDHRAGIACADGKYCKGGRICAQESRLNIALAKGIDGPELLELAIDAAGFCPLFDISLQEAKAISEGRGSSRPRSLKDLRKELALVNRQITQLPRGSKVGSPEYVLKVNLQRLITSREYKRKK